MPANSMDPVVRQQQPLTRVLGEASLARRLLFQGLQCGLRTHSSVIQGCDLSGCLLEADALPKATTCHKTDSQSAASTHSYQLTHLLGFLLFEEGLVVVVKLALAGLWLLKRLCLIGRNGRKLVDPVS